MSATIEEIRDTVTIVEVLAWYGAKSNLGNRYGEWKPIVCPFCADKGGSASVNIVAGRFLCHQCDAPRGNGKSGDVIDVVKYAENIHDTKEAMQWIERNLMR